MPASRQLLARVERILAAQPVTDLHTHCYAPSFGASPDPRGLLLWGIDELVTYHYLVAEVYRVVPAEGQGGMPYEKFWAMKKPEQADHIWKHLFAGRTPISEACRGVLTTLEKLGLDPNEKTLTRYRKWFAKQTADKYIDKVMAIANVDSITMTNAVFDDAEREKWEAAAVEGGVGEDPRFTAVLRIDPLLRDWPGAAARLAGWGYGVRPDFTGDTAGEVKHFLQTWLDRMKAIYVAVSLPPEFRYPSSESDGAVASSGGRVLRDCLLPLLAERRMPLALMIGARYRAEVNPALRDAGDMAGKAEVMSVVNLCREFPKNKFLVTMLSRENQHELGVAARKFGNLMIFGCWWFLNIPSLIEEITRMRVELLGTSFCPQHSDARVLDQLIYKWDHSRRIIAKVLADKYADLEAGGYRVTREHMQRDARLLLRDNFREFVKR
jgi:hypothetical protein